MKRVLRLLFLLAVVVPGIGYANYMRDIDYRVIPQQPVVTGPKIEVREFFWYGCPHCFHMEPILEKWLRTLPSDAKFVRTPAVFNPAWAPAARAFFTFQALGITNKVHYAFFRAIHVEHQDMNNANDVAAFLAKYGISRQTALNTYNSFSVNADVRRTQAMEVPYGIDSVPTFVVDGRYMTNPSIAGGERRCLRIVAYLIKKSATAHARPGTVK
ncbi:MAG: thiol:disulfide interchange protein DsbA/DsbL [Gammaproteobacteria bacterium]|nr:thiol:disulfide interchange protein DsbA/DsbL [Gammaproteobacteria bacterium]